MNDSGSFNPNFASYDASSINDFIAYKSMVEKEKATTYIDFCYYDIVSKMKLIDIFNSASPFLENPRETIERYEKENELILSNTTNEIEKIDNEDCKELCKVLSDERIKLNNMLIDVYNSKSV